MIPISLPSTGEEEWQAVREPLMSGWLTQGPQVEEFEKQFAARHEAEYAIATTSCTTAMHLMLAAAGIGAGDEVIVPSFTWVATANVVLYCGATPVFADVDPVTYNLDPVDVAAKVTPRTRAVIAVHLFGLMSDVGAIRAALPHEALVFEDAACAVGARSSGQSAGSLGAAAAFSFHPRKSITTGEGGMLTTSSPEIAELARRLRNHGASISEEERHAGPRPYLLPEFNLLGFNYRMTDLQGAVGRVQLGKLNHFIAERQQWAEYYFERFADLEWLQMPALPFEGQHAWQSFVVRFRDSAPVPRNEAMERLQDRGVSTRPGTHAIHMLGYYANSMGVDQRSLPGSKLCAETTLALPLHNRMSEADFARVADEVIALGR